ncbi:MAG: nuclear transport factor 2 family protein [Stackebrandtia sp.]
MTDWPIIHKAVVERFAAGWDAPGPHAWDDDFLSQDVELNQPMVPRVTNLRMWHEEMRRLLSFLPDLRADVSDWAGREDRVFIRFELRATLAGKPVTVRAVDELWIEPDGTVRRRDSFFDSAPLAQTVMRRPSTWISWWRSGLGPLLARRGLLGKP